MKMKIFIEQKTWQQSTSVYIVGEDANGKRFRMKPVTLEFETINEGQMYDPAMVFTGQMSADFLGAFHDAIVEVGYRPKDNGIEAIKYHLEDMRKLVFREVKSTGATDIN